MCIVASCFQQLIIFGLVLVFSSSEIATLLGLVLAYGNYMNGNTQRGQADGFHLEVLLKLRDVKTKDSELNLLQYTVKQYLKQYERCLDKNKNESRLPSPVSLSNAAQVSIGCCMSSGQSRINSCQLLSILLNSCQLLSTLITCDQFSFTLIYSCQLLSTLIYYCRLSSTLIYSYHLLSTLISSQLRISTVICF